MSRQRPPNILDLRTVVNERTTSRPTKRKHQTHASAYSRPARAWTVDWTALRRELLKYGLGLAVAAVAVLGITFGLTTWQHVRDASAAANAGVTEIEHGLTALNQKDVQIAKQSFITAVSKLDQAKTELHAATAGTDRIVDMVPLVGRQYRAIDGLLTAAIGAAEAGLDASGAVPIGTGPASLSFESDGVIRGSLGWFATLANDSDRLERVANKLLSSYRTAANISPSSVPKQIRPSFEAWQRIGDGLFGSPDRLTALVKLMIGIGGQKSEQEYLVMFQNDDELRPTGGFMGTYLLVKFQRGTFAITDAPGNGPYALKDQLPKTIRPPAPLDEITPAMAIIDANWYPDARVSAQAIQELYRRARGFRPTGVIFVTPAIVERLLAITGPIAIPGTETTVSAETFVNTAEAFAEFDFDKALNAPKELLIQLLPTLMQKLVTLSTPDALKSFAAVFDETDRGNIIITSDQELVASMAAKLGWDGAIRPGSGDFFADVGGNVNSGKTDRSIQVTTSIVVTPSPGDWRHTVTMTRQHHAVAGTPLHGVDNLEYIRYIVPVGANVTSIVGASSPPTEMLITPPTNTTPLTLDGDASSLTLVDPQRKTSIARGSQYTTIGFWSFVRPGETQTITVTYTVPHDQMVKDGAWSLQWRRQPGSLNRTWNVLIDAKRGDFQPTGPTSGWGGKDQKWFWTGKGDYSAVLSGNVKEK